MPKRKVFDSDEEEDSILFNAFKEEENGEKDDAGEEEDDVEEDLLAPEANSDEDDDDDMPVEVGKMDSRQSALETLKDAMNQINQQKQAEKDKRKKKQAQFAAQKKEKQTAVDKLRLPDDVLDSVEEKKITKKKKQKKQKVQEEEDISDDEGMKMTEEEMEEILGNCDEFIPLESGDRGVQAVQLNQELKKPRSSMQKAVDFRESRFNAKHITRQSSKAMTSQWAKTRIRKNLAKRIK